MPEHLFVRELILKTHSLTIRFCQPHEKVEFAHMHVESFLGVKSIHSYGADLSYVSSDDPESARIRIDGFSWEGKGQLEERLLGKAYTVKDKRTSKPSPALLAAPASVPAPAFRPTRSKVSSQTEAGAATCCASGEKNEPGLTDGRPHSLRAKKRHTPGERKLSSQKICRRLQPHPRQLDD